MSLLMQLISALLQIDYQTFLTLSEDDLKEVGVSTFGARRKLLLAISGESRCLCPAFHSSFTKNQMSS